MMKRVIIESPYAGNIKANEKYGELCLNDSLHRGEAPLASHLLYTRPNVLDDTKPEERKLGMNAGFAWTELAEAVIVYTDMGMSKGMVEGVKRAESFGIPVEYREIYDEFGNLPKMTNWQSIAFNRGALLDTLRELNPKLFEKALKKTPEYPKPKKKLMVVPNWKREEIAKFYKGRKNLRIIGFGETLAGRRFDEIFVIYDTDIYGLYYSESAKTQKYINCCVKTKLHPNGKFLELN